MANEPLDIERHNRVLLRCLQTAHPVMHNGLQRFIHTLTFSASGGSIDTTVYLRGQPGDVPAHEITPDTRHDPAGAIGARARTKTEQEQECTE